MGHSEIIIGGGGILREVPRFGHKVKGGGWGGGGYQILPKPEMQVCLFLAESEKNSMHSEACDVRSSHGAAQMVLYDRWSFIRDTDV